MSLAIVRTRAQVGVDAPPVTVEVHLTNGLPGLAIVGLPEAAVRESKDRVRSALLNAQYEYPLRRVTINLAPADLPKEGGRFDLPIALGILAASGQIPAAALAGLSSLITSPPAAWLELYNEHIPDTPLKIAIALVAVGLVGPIAEELLYRGVVHRLCRRHWGALPAAVISSLLFALLHGEPWFLFGLFALGMLYAFVYETTGSLTLCVAAHSLHNVISMVMMLREGALAAPPEAFVASDLPWLVGSLVVLVPALRGLRALRRRGD